MRDDRALGPAGGTGSVADQQVVVEGRQARRFGNRAALDECRERFFVSGRLADDEAQRARCILQCCGRLRSQVVAVDGGLGLAITRDVRNFAGREPGRKRHDQCTHLEDAGHRFDKFYAVREIHDHAIAGPHAVAQQRVGELIGAHLELAECKPVPVATDSELVGIAKGVGGEESTEFHDGLGELAAPGSDPAGLTLRAMKMTAERVLGRRGSDPQGLTPIRHHLSGSNAK